MLHARTCMQPFINNTPLIQFAAHTNCDAVFVVFLTYVPSYVRP